MQRIFHRPTTAGEEIIIEFDRRIKSYEYLVKNFTDDVIQVSDANVNNPERYITIPGKCAEIFGDLGHISKMRILPAATSANGVEVRVMKW